MTVSSTVRWPERLAHLATLLRAECTALLSLTPDGPHALHVYRARADLDWGAVLGGTVDRLRSERALAFPIPAGRWVEEAAFALIAPLESPDGSEPRVLCALRRGFPFDTVEIAAADAATALLRMSAEDERDLEEERRSTAALGDRLGLLRRLIWAVHDGQDTSAVLDLAVAELAAALDATSASIMLREGDELAVRASAGIPDQVRGTRRRLGEGIAGSVAETGESLLIRGELLLNGESPARVGTGTHTGMGESYVLPLRSEAGVVGVLSVGREPGAGAFTGRDLSLLEATAEDLGRVAGALQEIDRVHRDRSHAVALSEVARLAAADERDLALGAAAGAFGHDAIAVVDASGVVAVHAREGDPECRSAAIAAATAQPDGGGGPDVQEKQRAQRPRDHQARDVQQVRDPDGVRVGFARHDRPYAPEEEALAARTAETLGYIGRPTGAPRTEPHPTAGALRVLVVEEQGLLRLGLRALLHEEGFVVSGMTATCGEAVDLLGRSRADVALVDLATTDVPGAAAVARIKAAAAGLPVVAFGAEHSAALVRAALRAGAAGYVPKGAPPQRLAAALRAATAGVSALTPDIAALLAAPDEPSAEVFSDALAEPLPREPQRSEPPRGQPVPGEPRPGAPEVGAPETADSRRAEERAGLTGETPEVGEQPVQRGEAVRQQIAGPLLQGRRAGTGRDALTARELELLRYMAEGQTNKEIARTMVLAEDTVKKAVQMLIAKLGAADRTHAVVLALRAGFIT